MGLSWKRILETEKRLISMKKKNKFSVSFNAPYLQMKLYEKSLHDLTSKIVESGTFLYGRQVVELEKNLSRTFRREALTLASGHDALLLSLQALRLSHKDEVIFPANVYPTAFPIFQSGVKPILCDVDASGQLDPHAVEKVLSSRTKVIVIVHLYGLVGQLDEIIRIAREHKLILIEDCAQAYGSKFNGKYVGTFGDIGCFSFYPTKNIGTMGDGGAIITKNRKLYSYIFQARQYGESKRYKSTFVSGHSRLPEFQSGVINVILKDYKEVMEKKLAVYNTYLREFSKAPFDNNVRILRSHVLSSPSLHLFVIEVKQRQRLMTYLSSKGIEAHIHYPYSIHRVKAFHIDKKQNYPMSDRLSKNCISLPFHQFLTHSQITYVVSTIAQFYGKT